MLKLHLSPFFVLFLLLACSDRLTPWDTDVPNEYRNLTERNLQKLAELDEAKLPMKIALIGDPQGTPIDIQRVVKSIEEHEGIRFIMVLGDFTDYGLLHEYLWTAKALEHSRLPHLTVIGNHDAIALGKTIYKKMYGPYDYTFKDAGLKFVMFNNNQFEFGRTDFSWLQQNIDENSIAASHVPPVHDIHSPEQIEEWLKINGDASLIASLHGHRGGKTDFEWTIQKVPYYVVPKVTGVRYSIMTISEERKVSFQICTPACEVQP